MSDTLEQKAIPAYAYSASSDEEGLSLQRDWTPEEEKRAKWK